MLRFVEVVVQQTMFNQTGVKSVSDILFTYVSYLSIAGLSTSRHMQCWDGLVFDSAHVQTAVSCIPTDC
jgi:ABC-type amino acid transport system permease subunit